MRCHKVDDEILGDDLQMVELDPRETVSPSCTRAAPSRMADRVIQHAPRLQGKSQGEGSLLGSLFGFLERR